MESAKSDNEEDKDEKSEFVSKLSLAFKSSRTTEREGPRDMGATATLETETQHDRDARAIMERAEKMKKVVCSHLQVSTLLMYHRVMYLICIVVLNLRTDVHACVPVKFHTWYHGRSNMVAFLILKSKP